MNGNTTDSSPLLLYQKAWTLHYTDRKIAQACDIYEEIVRKFPESEVSSYSSIQLQKIHASEVTRRLARRTMASISVLAFCIVNFLGLIAIAVMLIVHLSGVGSRITQARFLNMAIARMYAGRDNDALDALKSAKIADPGDITSFAMAAEIYRKNKEFLKARKEFETYRRLNPGDPLAEIEIESINEDEDSHVSRTMTIKEEATTIPEEVVKEEDSAADARIDERKKRTPRTMPEVRKTKRVIPIDSIRFF
jgi:tetratricopeptide (TPR) repeat protein